VRCFLAIDLPDGVRKGLGRVQERLSKAGGGVRWVAPESIHLTMKFLGEVSDRQVAELCKVAQEIGGRSEPFEFAVRGAGCFPERGGVRVVWVGLVETSGRLQECQRLCEEAFEAMGFPREGRAFVPHLTLGRVKDPSKVHGLREAVASLADYEGGEVSAEELVLFESILSPKGATYVALCRAPLSASTEG